MKIYFDHEKLVAYQEALKFAEWCRPVLDGLSKSYAVREQLDRARTSIPLNIAEGSAKFTAPDRCRFFDIARGSAMECAACIDLLLIDGHVTVEQMDEGKNCVRQIVALLVGLIKANIPDRFAEDAQPYRVNSVSGEQD
jgi:four helix bundle protein